MLVPKHIAVIPDGNRRWAKKHGVSLEEAYEKGIRKIGEFVKWCKEFEIEIVSAWGFSTDNIKREKEEVEKLFSLFDKYLNEIIKEYEKKSKEEIEEAKRKYNVRVRFLGRREIFPQKIRDAMEKIEKLTEKNEKYQLNLLLGYGGREELVDAVNAIISKGIKRVDEKIIEEHLYTAGIPHPDLVIRTSGEIRLSGLMIWQTAYSELYFTKKLWPDFTKSDLKKALENYSKRVRKFGK